MKREVSTRAPGNGLKRNKHIEALKDNMGQNWTSNTYSRYYYDQYGFFIYYGKDYRLEYKGRVIVTLYSLTAAKTISTIILNDIILNKKI